ncbi:MAG TPA: hypothetical protein VJ346_03940, partial [Bacteroidales bacterium]|nr:hypothetical protein [Bacteroidales bacterium]
LATIQQQLLNLQENLRLDLTEQQLVANRKVLDSIMKYLAIMRKSCLLHLILSGNAGDLNQ